MRKGKRIHCAETGSLGDLLDRNLVDPAHFTVGVPAADDHFGHPTRPQEPVALFDGSAPHKLQDSATDALIGLASNALQMP